MTPGGKSHPLIVLARDLEKRGIHIDVDFKARVAELRAAERRARQMVQMAPEVAREIQRLIRTQQARAAAQLSRERSKKRAATITRKLKARAAELKRCGESAPVRQAEMEVAEQYGHANGPALNRWLRRNR